MARCRWMLACVVAGAQAAGLILPQAARGADPGGGFGKLPSQPPRLPAGLGGAPGGRDAGGPGGLPDLVVSLSGPGEAVPDRPFAVRVVVRNRGRAAAPGYGGKKGYLIDLVLSRDARAPVRPAPPARAGTEDGRLARIKSTRRIGPGGSVTYPLRAVRLPRETRPGRYFLCAVVDPNRGVRERDEGNNVTCVPLQVARDGRRGDAFGGLPRGGFGGAFPFPRGGASGGGGRSGPSGVDVMVPSGGAASGVGTVVIREMRLGPHRVARDGWKEWDHVVVLENTGRRPATVTLWTEARERGGASGRPRNRGRFTLRGGERREVRVPSALIATDCALGWLAGEGARRPVRGGRPSSEYTHPPERRVCVPFPRRWRVDTRIELFEVRADGDDRSPTTWDVCLEVGGTKRCRKATVRDNQRLSPPLVLEVRGTPVATGATVPGLFRVVDHDDWPNADDVAEERIDVRVAPPAPDDAPGTAAGLRRGRSTEIPFSKRGGRPGEGPSGVFRLIRRYRPLD